MKSYALLLYSLAREGGIARTTGFRTSWLHSPSPLERRGGGKRGREREREVYRVDGGVVSNHETGDAMGSFDVR